MTEPEIDFTTPEDFPDQRIILNEELRTELTSKLLSLQEDKKGLFRDSVSFPPCSENETEESKKFIEDWKKRDLDYDDEEKKYRFECRSCGAKYSELPIKCSCGSRGLIEIQKTYSQNEIEASLEKFRNKNLLELIHNEISKDHIGDDNAKMTNFLIDGSALLKNERRRQSQAITGDTSTGKDNLIKTNLKHMPRESFAFLTSGTQATIEDDIKDKRIIAFSEVNSNKDNGANKYLVEILKQKSEGGTSALKKDIRTGMKTARHEEGEQATIIYGTTESSMDEELQTRFIRTPVETDSIRIKKVNENTLETFADLDKLLKSSEQKDSWIRIGLTHFWKDLDQPEIYLPYAKFLKEKLKEKDIFDHSDPRSQRDIKRLLSLTCAMTYLFQLQREKIKYNGKTILISEPQDLINTLKISGEFFNQSYSGLDKRLTNVLKSMKENEPEWVARDFLQEEMKVSRNTIKSYCQTLANEGLIEGSSGKELNLSEGLKVYDGNKIYYKRCQKGSKKPLIGCEINELKRFLTEKTQKTIDTFEFNDLSSIKEEFDTLKGVKNEGVKLGKNETDGLKFDKNLEIDTFSLTPFKKPCDSCRELTSNLIQEIPICEECSNKMDSFLVGGEE